MLVQRPDASAPRPDWQHNPAKPHRAKSRFTPDGGHRSVALRSRMSLLHLHILAADRATAERIERTVKAGDAGCSTQIVADSPALLQALAASAKTGGIAAAPGIAPDLRHELNNHLALIRMLSDLLAEAPGLSPLYAAKAREIGTAAEAAAQAVRRAQAGAA